MNQYLPLTTWHTVKLCMVVSKSGANEKEFVLNDKYRDVNNFPFGRKWVDHYHFKLSEIVSKPTKKILTLEEFKKAMKKVDK